MTFDVDNLPDLHAGIYEHYKGPLYLVLGYGHDANDADRVTVVYVGLELDDAHRGGRFSTRTAEDFFSRVHKDGTACDEFCSDDDQESMPRFRFLRSVY